MESYGPAVILCPHRCHILRQKLRAAPPVQLSYTRIFSRLTPSRYCQIAELEQQLLGRTATADRQQQQQAAAAGERTVQQLEEQFGQQLSQITGELRSEARRNGA